MAGVQVLGEGAEALSEEREALLAERRLPINELVANEIVVVFDSCLWLLKPWVPGPAVSYAVCSLSVHASVSLFTSTWCCGFCSANVFGGSILK